MNVWWKLVPPICGFGALVIAGFSAADRYVTGAMLAALLAFMAGGLIR